MKTIESYIQERLHITKDTYSQSSLLDKVFNNVEDLIKELKIYFEDKLYNKDNVRLNKYSTKYLILTPSNWTTSIEVNNHFELLFKDDEFLQCGCVDNVLIIQTGFFKKNKKFIKGYAISVKDGYKFGKDNFINWINNLSENYSNIKKYFINN